MRNATRVVSPLGLINYTTVPGGPVIVQGFGMVVRCDCLRYTQLFMMFARSMIFLIDSNDSPLRFDIHPLSRSMSAGWVAFRFDVVAVGERWMLRVAGYCCCAFV